jgi:hypothetical protein
VTKSPPITRYNARFAGEFMVSLPLARLLNDLRKSLISLARPRGFEPLTFAFGGQKATARNFVWMRRSIREYSACWRKVGEAVVLGPCIFANALILLAHPTGIEPVLPPLKGDAGCRLWLRDTRSKNARFDGC